MSNYDGSKFDVFIYIESTPEVLFNKWATSSGLESFFIKTVSYKSPDGKQREPNEHVEQGDQYTWQFIHGFVIEGSILEVIPNQKMSFTFGDEQLWMCFL